MDDVKPNFDVFSLGKVLWSMVSGKPFLRLWYFSEREYDLERIFPEEPAMRWATRIFRKCIVDQEPDCLKDAAELLTKRSRLFASEDKYSARKRLR
jgi:hypothetical protein